MEYFKMQTEINHSLKHDVTQITKLMRVKNNQFSKI